MRKHFPLNANGAEDSSLLPWTDGVPMTGAQGSYPGQALMTDQEAEILTALAAAGLPQAGADLTQLAQAICRGVFVGVLGGSANSLTFALPGGVVFPALLPGMQFSGIVAVPNTGAVTIVPSGFAGAPGPLAFLRRDGSPLASGDLTAGAIIDFRFSGTDFRAIVPVASESSGTVNNYLEQNFYAPPGTGFAGSQNRFAYLPVTGQNSNLQATFTCTYASTITCLSILNTSPSNGNISNAASITVNGNKFTGSADSVSGSSTSVAILTVPRGATIVAASDCLPNQTINFNASQYLIYSVIPS